MILEVQWWAYIDDLPTFRNSLGTGWIHWGKGGGGGGGGSGVLGITGSFPSFIFHTSFN